ncbi:hypothetical protein MalM25_02950 [Planctomycetes bacterium MalM25]|nr:hypothetical protein MalM25_02950 [Planctomycetes bacterium MalM25]
MFFPLLPLAWLEGLGPLLLVAVWVIRAIYQAISEQKEAEEAKQAKARRAGDPERGLPPRQVVGKADGPAPEGDLRSEIDDFLKRIGEEFDPEPAQEAKAAPVAPPEPVAPPPPRRRPIDPFEEPAPRPRRATPQVVEPQPELKADPEPLRPAPVLAKSEPRRELRHLPESQLAEQAAHLGERIAGADDRVESRLQGKFDHRLGKLGASELAPEPATSDKSETGAQRIKALLARPGGVREAVVLSEILRRPGDQL